MAAYNGSLPTTNKTLKGTSKNLWFRESGNP